MKNNYLKALALAILLFLFTGLFIYISNNLLKIIRMEHIIEFSFKMLLVESLSPLIIYATYSCVHFLIFNRKPKCCDAMFKYLMIAGLILCTLSIPGWFYIDYHLENSGYLICKQTNYRFPATYVTDLSLCDAP
ncbi:DUF1240 domain-containing protein [Erwiniaceae bacterium CAU 1747]